MHLMLAGSGILKRTSNNLVCMSNNAIMVLQEEKVMQAKEPQTSSTETTTVKFCDGSPSNVLCK